MGRLLLSFVLVEEQKINYIYTGYDIQRPIVVATIETKPGD